MVDRQRPDAPERDFDRLMERVERLETATYGRNASVHRGSTEFVGEDSLIVRGSQLVVGTIRTIGRQIIEGLGILDVFGLINLFGAMRVTTGGGITVEDGGDIVVNGGEIRVGDVLLKDGKIYVGEGAAQIIIDSVTRKILAGDVEIEFDRITVGGGDSPARLQDGALSFDTGGTVAADTSNDGVRMAVGANQVYVGTGAASMQVGTQSVLLTQSGVFMPNLPVIEQSLLPDSMPVGSVYISEGGQLFRVVAD